MRPQIVFCPVSEPAVQAAIELHMWRDLKIKRWYGPNVLAQHFGHEGVPVDGGITAPFISTASEVAEDVVGLAMYSTEDLISQMNGVPARPGQIKVIRLTFETLRLPGEAIRGTAMPCYTDLRNLPIPIVYNV